MFGILIRFLSFFFVWWGIILEGWFSFLRRWDFCGFLGIGIVCCKWFFENLYFLLFFWGLFVLRIVKVIVWLISLNKFDFDMLIFWFDWNWRLKKEEIFLNIKLMKYKIWVILYILMDILLIIVELLINWKFMFRIRNLMVIYFFWVFSLFRIFGYNLLFILFIFL